MSASHTHLLSLFNKIHSTVELGNGVIRSIDNLGLRPLASRMRAHSKYNNIGRYIRLQLQINPIVYNDIINRLNIDEQIIRHLTIKHNIVPQINPKTPVFLTQYHQTRHQSIQPSNDNINQIRHTTPLDYYLAKYLLSNKLCNKIDIVELPRYQPDPQWKHTSARLLTKYHTVQSNNNSNTNHTTTAESSSS